MLGSNSTLLRYHHPLFHVWRSLGLRHKNGQKKCEHGLYTICHSSIMGILRNGQRVTSDTISLIIGFIAVLLIDRHFYLLKLTPLWWMKLRIPLNFPCNIFVRHWDNYMTSDIKTVHIYDTKSSEYLANISKEHPHKTLKYFAENLLKSQTFWIMDATRPCCRIFSKPRT